MLVVLSVRVADGCRVGVTTITPFARPNQTILGSSPGAFPQRSSSRPSTTRWGRPTKGLISNYRAHVVSPKAYHDLTNDSRWTPFVGVGASLTRADLRNSRRLLHNTLLQRCQQMDLSSNVANRHYSLVESNWTNRLRRRPIRPLDRFLVCQPYCRPLWPSLQV